MSGKELDLLPRTQLQQSIWNELGCSAGERLVSRASEAKPVAALLARSSQSRPIAQPSGADPKHLDVQIPSNRSETEVASGSRSLDAKMHDVRKLGSDSCETC